MTFGQPAAALALEHHGLATPALSSRRSSISLGSAAPLLTPETENMPGATATPVVFGTPREPTPADYGFVAVDSSPKLGTTYPPPVRPSYTARSRTFSATSPLKPQQDSLNVSNTSQYGTVVRPATRSGPSSGTDSPRSAAETLRTPSEPDTPLVATQVFAFDSSIPATPPSATCSSFSLESYASHPVVPPSSTPTAELGPFEYPTGATEKYTPPQPPCGSASGALPLSLSTSYPHGSHRGSNHSPTAAVNAAASPERKIRRGSIASGQISRMSLNLPGREPEHHRNNSSSSLPVLTNRNSTSAIPTTTPTTTHKRGSVTPSGQVPSASFPFSERSPPALSAAPPGPVYLPPMQPRRGGPLSFAHAPLAAPIPPSLLARRGSVPMNNLLALPAPAGGWATSASCRAAAYHTPAPTRPRSSSRRLSAREDRPVVPMPATPEMEEVPWSPKAQVFAAPALSTVASSNGSADSGSEDSE